MTTWTLQLSLLSVLLALTSSLNAQTKLFKCIVQGRTVYQQTARPVVASEESSRPAEAAPASSSPASHTARRQTAKHAASAASDATSKADTTGAESKPLH